MAYSEENESTLFIDNEGNKDRKDYVVTYKDGVEVARTKPHKTHTPYYENAPQETLNFIEAKKNKRTKKTISGLD